MKKIPSIFKRNYDGDRLVRPELVEGCEWVLEEKVTPTEKFDGTSCMIENGLLYKRRDRRMDKRTGKPKPAPAGWVPCEDAPNEHTGHWPGWLEVGLDPDDKWHLEASSYIPDDTSNGTYELVGPKIQGNPYKLERHALWKHGSKTLGFFIPDQTPKTLFDTIYNLFLVRPEFEGIVMYHPDGRMAKIKRKDFGLPWPVKEAAVHDKVV